MTSWIDKLLAARPSFIPMHNPFLFACKGEYSHLRGSDALRRFAADCGAKRPELLTLTKLRKQIASLAQVVSLKENELDSLATFMGHDIRIHAQFYRVPSDVVQIAKISKLFLAAEKGQLAKFAGQQLNDIVIDDDDTVQEESSGDSDSDADSAPVDDSRPPVSSELVAEAKGATDSEPSADEGVKTDRSCRKKQRRAVVKRKWTDDEADSIASHFATEILNKRLPGKAAIEAYLQKTGIDRKWTNVKDFIRNHYFT